MLAADPGCLIEELLNLVDDLFVVVAVHSAKVDDEIFLVA